ncbi:hypothetical protein FHS39_002214 [Streptomyces olivoverticillatus]|uniref:DUF4034 domain-containing protein n=1 Tax=Streptomyces olivoverticillatus TaxID=66427 RepID=A0A7W7LMW1_9ACTN|nr:hypothetical protein [Streptomyces olivoverticillatus]MBB4893183.1 hypothetical protein [Streptomyces olivoverticillatus]
MFSPRSLLNLPRTLRHASALSVSLPPAEAVVVDAPDAPLRAALTAAASGGFGPARELLAATRQDMQWERRSGYVAALAEFALHNPGWLDAWLADEPENPDAVLVKADLCIDQAWEVRSAARANAVSRDQFQGFFALLQDAAPVIGAAIELNPADPVPWRIALTHALGTQASREVFDSYWEEAVARAPHHFGCHSVALQYLCEKWYGSHEEMFAFAENAAEQALPGSKLHALPLKAAVEYLVVASAGTREKDPSDGTVPQARIDAAIRRAQELSAHYEAGDPEIAPVRNDLALMLLLHERWSESLEQFRAIGVHATEFPWVYFGDPRKEFLDFRTGVRVHVARNTPFFSRPPQPEPAAPTAGAGGGTEAEHSSLAVVSAPFDTVADATFSGPPLRLATSADGWTTLVEVALHPDPARRGPLLAQGGLVREAGVFTTSEWWPALILHRAGDRRGFTLIRRGKHMAEHHWDPAAPVPGLDEVTATARAVAEVYQLDDIRPLTTVLRGTDDPAGRQAALLAALRLPPVPEAFATRAEALTDLPGARILARRGALEGWEAAGGQAVNPVYTQRRPKRWWALRLVLLPVLVSAAVYGWTSEDVLFVKPLIATFSSAVVGGQLVTAWRRRPRGAGGTVTRA